MSTARKRACFAGACIAALLVGATAYLARPQRRTLRVIFDDRDYQSTSTDEAERIKQMFDGGAGMDTVRRSDRAKAFRIGEPPSRVSDEARVEDFPILAGPVFVDEIDRAEVVTALLSPDSYRWELAKGCEPTYGVVLSFERQQDRVDVFLCFECSILLVAHNGVVSGGEDFDDIHPTLVRVAKALFPLDADIQRLPDRGCANRQ